MKKLKSFAVRLPLTVGGLLPYGLRLFLHRAFHLNTNQITTTPRPIALLFVHLVEISVAGLI
jgi:hypothetical protein